MSKNKFEVPSESIVHEEFDGDLVILNLETGQYFGLNLTASLIWNALMQGASADSLASINGISSTLQSFITRLVDLGLVVETTSPGTQPDPVLKKSLEDASAAPDLEIYDDLSDLILADPIHDVDNAEGWPKMPGQS
ncbi:MAG TPA: PqqD family protein [Aliiroseovarius sp.]|nr:PqqD family protein [Aliiroseovarius sp.]